MEVRPRGASLLCVLIFLFSSIEKELCGNLNVSNKFPCALVVGLDGLGVTCSSRDPRLAGSNPAEFDDFFRT